jgi:hypothetical protein
MIESVIYEDPHNLEFSFELETKIPGCYSPAECLRVAVSWKHKEVRSTRWKDYCFERNCGIMFPLKSQVVASPAHDRAFPS